MPWSLIFKNLFHHPIRTFLTLGSLVIAMFTICFLQTIVVSLQAGVKNSASDRLIVQSAVSLFVNLPLSYQSKIESVDGVKKAMKMQWFGGVYQDPSNFFAQFAVDHDSFLEVYDEVKIIEGQADQFKTKRTACIIGYQLSESFGWKIGDRVPIIGTIFPKNDGSPWEFEVVAIYKASSPNLDNRTLFFHWDYLEESIKSNAASGPPGPGIYVLRLDKEANPVTVSNRIDQLFENGPQRVQSTTEAEFQRQFVTMLGNVPTFISSIGGGVLFAILLASLNTMLMSARQRTKDFGILKALGFTDAVTFQLLLYESLLLTLIGGGLGIGLAKATEPTFGKAFAQLLPNYTITPETMGLAAGLSLAIGLIAGLLPAYQASRLRTVDALRSEL